MTNRRTFIHQISLGALGVGFITAFPGSLEAFSAQYVPAGRSLPRSSPEKQGISSAAIRQFLSAVEKSGLEFHSVMVVRHGHVVAEGWWSPFAPELKHTLYSLSKSFTSTAVGLAVADGKLSVEDPVISFFRDDLPPVVSENLAAMKIRHLLTMNTGHAVDTLTSIRDAGDNNWAKVFLSVPVEHTPGSHFLYNTGATYMLSAIVQKVTGWTVFDFLSERLFKPLGIEGADWETDPNGISVGGFGLRVRTEDIAKFGQLYLQKGMWNGKQLLPAQWVEDASKKQTTSQAGDNDWSQGYGYQFWRCKPEPGFYRGDGAFGQFCIVIPQLDTVVAITAESFNLQLSMTLVWENLLPALGQTSLPKNKTEHQLLRAELANLALKPLPVSTPSPMAARLSGKTFKLETNEWGLESAAFQWNAGNCLVTLTGAGFHQTIDCGMGRWVVKGNEKKDPKGLFALPFRTSVPSKIAACAAWQNENTLALKWKYIENVHGELLTCVFDGDQVTISLLSSMAAGNKAPDGRKALVGRSV